MAFTNRLKSLKIAGFFNFVSKNSYASSSSASTNKGVEFGIMFDIDGVLTRGQTLLPKTKDCIKIITDSNGNFKVPTLFLTNAGNELRSSKSAKLSQILGIKVYNDQLVMSHSPLRLMNTFHIKRCLISGQGPIVEIANNLGFKSVITMDDLRHYYPHLDVVDHKRRTFMPCVLGRYFPPIDAIILFGESIRWETNLQLMIDVIMCNGKLDQPPKKFPKQNLPILACNADMVWMAEAPMPRFGHGTFLHCLEQIYQKLSGNELKYECVVGKPSEITYFYAENMLRKHADSIGIKNQIKRIYAIGDNLDTDIYGANTYNKILTRLNAEKRSDVLVDNKNNSIKRNEEINDNLVNNISNNWIKNHEQKFSHLDKNFFFTSKAEACFSLLVRTGVFQGDINDIQAHNSQLVLAHKDMAVDASLIKPTFVLDDAYEAVKLIMEMEKYN